MLSAWNGSNFIYEKKKLPGATFKVTAGADIYKADRTKVYNAGDVVAESLTSFYHRDIALKRWKHCVNIIKRSIPKHVQKKGQYSKS